MFRHALWTRRRELVPMFLPRMTGVQEAYILSMFYFDYLLFGLEDNCSAWNACWELEVPWDAMLLVDGTSQIIYAHVPSQPCRCASS